MSEATFNMDVTSGDSCFISFEGKNRNLAPKISHVVCLQLLIKSCPIYKLSPTSNMQLRTEILSV